MIKVTNSPNEYMGTSDETKPSDVPKYTLFLELDTGDIYYSSTGPSPPRPAKKPVITRLFLFFDFP